MSYDINITDRVTSLLDSMRRALRPGSIERVMARAVTNRIKQHLFELDATRPNKLGGDRTHFWSQAAKSTHWRSKAGEFTVGINQVGFRQRLEGGVIRPVSAKMLTIPAIPEAYGHRAGEFHNLRFAVLNGHPALVETQATRVKIGRKKKDGSRSVTGIATTTGLKVYFWLARSVNQVGDASVLPASDDLISAAVSAAESTFKRAESNGGTA